MLILVPAIIFALWAQWKVKSAIKKYSKVTSNSGLTGYEIAMKLLERNSITNVGVERATGKLSDHYDPKARVVRLSDQIYNGTSVASIGIAAHEVGHAIQHNKGYTPLKWRTAFFPVANLGSQLWIWLFIGGMLFTIPQLTDAGIIFFSATLVFQLITLPVEFNASRRALAQLTDGGYITRDDTDGARAVLNAAAMTYVAAAAVAVAQLVRLLILRGRR